MAARGNPLRALAEQRRGRPVVLDGGLATELEARGHALDDALWSARLLVDAPDAIRAVHRAYAEAGARILITATYQATVPALVARGLAPAAARAVFGDATRLARGAASAWPGVRVAASVGPYGAARADGSEYRGDYGLDARALRAWHEERFGLLAGSGADLLACETIPSGAEAEALAALLDGHDGIDAWFSFSCRDGARLRDGTPVEEAADAVAGARGTVAVGVNCTAPRFVEELVARLVACVGPALPVLAYPNSGEGWDAVARRWTGEPDVPTWLAAARTWRAAGATALGGCCRTGPAHVRGLAALE